MNSLVFLLLFLLLPYSSLSATIDSAAIQEDNDGYAMQSLQLPYRREANRYRDDVQAPAQLATSRNEMQLREIAREAGRILNARLPKIRYAGVKNTNPSDQGLSELLREYEQLRDEVSRLERTLSPSEKRKRLALTSPTTPVPPPPPPPPPSPPTLPPTTFSPPVALLQPLSPAKHIKRRKLRKHRRLNELPLLSDPSLIEALQKGQVFILKENRLQAIDATQSAALSEELRKSSISDAPVSLPISRSEPVISLPLVPLPVQTTTTTTPVPTTTTTTEAPTTTTLPPLNEQEQLFLAQLKDLFPGDPSLDNKFNEYRRRTVTTSPPVPSPPPTTTPPPILTPPPSPPAPSLPIRSFVFVPGTSLKSNTSPPITPVLSFLPSSEPLPLRELSNEIHPLNRPHASSQPIAVPETFGRRAGALFINAKGEIVDGKGNRLDIPTVSKATPDTVPTGPFEAPVVSRPLPPPQSTVLQPSPTESEVLTESTEVQQQPQQYVQQVNRAVSLPEVPQSIATPQSVSDPLSSVPQTTRSPAAQYLSYQQYLAAIGQYTSTPQVVRQPTEVQTVPSVPTVPTPTVSPLPSTLRPSFAPLPTASRVDLSQYTTKTFTVPSTTLAPSTTVSPSTTTLTVASTLAPSTVPPLPLQFPSYPSPYHPFYPPPPQSKLDAPVFERYSTWEIPAGTGDILQSNSTSNSSLPQTLLLVDPTKKANDPPTVIQLPPNYPSYPPANGQPSQGYYPPYPQYPYPPYPYPSYGASPYGGGSYGGAWPAYPTPAPSTPHPLAKLFSQNEPTTSPEEGGSAPSQSTAQVISPQEAAAILAQFYSQLPKKN